MQLYSNLATKKVSKVIYYDSYIAGTQDLSLCYQGGTGQAFSLCGYTDADWAGDLDERKSTTGYWFTHGGGAKLARGV